MRKESKFDRSVSFAGTHNEVANWQRVQISQMSIHERLVSAGELTLRAYGLNPELPAPPVDKTLFSMRKHQNR